MRRPVACNLGIVERIASKGARVQVGSGRRHACRSCSHRALHHLQEDMMSASAFRLRADNEETVLATDL